MTNVVTIAAIMEANIFPQYTVSERIADGIVHVLSVAASITGVVLLFLIANGALPTKSILSLSVYAVGLVAVFLFSAAYNLTGGSPIKALLHRFDQAAIYLKIAATYTPFMAVKLAGWTGAGMLALVWSAATFGITTKLFFPNKMKRISIILYLVLGWCVVLVAVPLFGALTSRTLLLLIAGGVLYSVGVIFHLWEKLRYQNAIWHGFVLGGSACHYAAIVDSVALV